MNVDWSSLGIVLVVGVAVTIGLVGLFTLGIAGLSHHEAATERGTTAPVALAAGWTCFAAATAAVIYGISLLV